MYGISMEYVWNIHGIVWNIYGTCVEYVWNVYGICRCDWPWGLSCALGRIVTLRVLTAYIPRTPGPKTATRARPRPGLLPVGPRHVAPRPNVSYNLCRNEGISENMFRICVAYVWNNY